MTDSLERKIDLKLILAIIATGLMSFTGVVIETAMNITFPTLMNEFNIDISAVQWLTTGYLLLLAIIIPTSAFLKSRFKTKNLFITANLFFISGVVIDILAPTFSLLLLGRILQGCGTGIALPLMFNIVLEQVPFHKLGMMMGIATLVIAMSPAIGPFFGGMIIYYFGWRMIFVALLPLLIASFSLGVYAIRQVGVIKKISFDWIGHAFLSVSFTGLIFAASSAGAEGWTSLKSLSSIGIFLVAFTAFCRHSRRTANPIIHLSVFRIKSFAFSTLVLSIVQFICLGLGFLIPNYSQLVLGDSSFIAGCLLLPGCIIGAFLAPLSGKVLDSFGAKKPILFGNVCILIATVSYSLLSNHLNVLNFIFVYMIFTIGQGFAAGNSMTNGIKHLPEQLTSDGNAVCNTLQQLSGAIGTAVVSTIISAEQARLTNNMLATQVGSHQAFWLLAGLAILALVGSLFVFHYSQQQAAQENADRVYRKAAAHGNRIGK